MNKQEAIKKLESIKTIGNDARAACYNEGINAVITIIKQLDEPQKPVVPRFVADWIELCKEKADLISCLSGSYEYGVNQYKRITEDEDWLFEADHQELVARAWLYGYEVEKESLYMVPFLKDEEGNKKILVERNRQYDIIWGCENDGWCDLFTEEQIKSVNEEYWKFAELYEVSEDEKE
ncbi:DUF1642 domain-containing protein [Enterococcus faecium]|uniref:DUF1642 domain-containing protein n=1 Tax=Enterococcus TaxID=1350 RepID=UPI001A035E47|nr:DUF1642 domain-containing protein [Enterococcus lactis]EGP5006233.1 DUF1642 domain-containing protein [Enterococcus faecium]MDB7103927.1 DUF1642 domain-containing protein [Enterococcus faecium]MDB7250604.1 DUF1642 domain-containing protein [Enterococcus faecium]MDB7260844.1 DUF1642 domain-containing protein [Enterococcus faecium]MDB7278227.1 DUF1642 domain-containing protein [Enterococcus faecium]